VIEWHGEQVINEVHNRIRDNMLNLARDVVTKAVQYAPKRTGRLASAIDFDWNESTFTVVFTINDPEVDYAMFVEYGTRYMIPHPYLRPALNDIGPQYGFNFELSFGNTAQTDTKLLAAGPTFHMHKSLTAKQKEHVRKWLKPFSKAHWHGNVSRARVHARRTEF